MLLGASLFENVPLVKCMYLVFNRMPSGDTIGDLGLLLCPLSVECYSLLLFAGWNVITQFLFFIFYFLGFTWPVYNKSVSK